MHSLLLAAARAGHRTDSQALPPDILRFSLEYAGIPDPGAERARIEGMLGAGGFDLFAYSDEDPAILILQFPGVIREQSPEFLFAAADALADALGLISAVPDIDPPFSEIETRDASTESLGGLIWAACRSRADPPGNPDWAIELIKAKKVHDELGVTGRGIRIGQPDTGVAAHDEIAEGLDKASGFNFIDNSPDPTDPLSPSMASPGHGTGTSSVVISRPTHVITGSAPGATLVPIRCLNAVVIGSGTAVAKAIDHARAQGCRVVTMSLGGIYAGRELRRAVARAVRADMILLAAAGNCVKMVTYPAWDRNVIAVAGVNFAGARWKGSCRGSAVDIAAPGENVHVARREAVPPGHQPTPAELSRIAPDGQGTSFAVALTAGVAALWLEHFGFDSCRDEARRRGNLPVQELFRAALRASANALPGWDHRNMGAGIVDAMKLLSTPLDRIPLGAAGPLPETGPALALLADAADVARYSAELEFLSFDRALRGDPERAAELETPLAPAPSPGLARRIVLPPAALMPAPAAIIGPLTPPVPVETALRRLGAAGTPGLEATGAVSLEGALERIRAEGPASILASAESVLASRRALPGSPADAGLQDEALRRMEQALAAVVSGDSARLAAEGDHRFALEALVRLTGRPALRLTEDDADLATNPNIGIWAGHLLPNRDRWRPGADAVGRIDVMDHRGEWVHGGTGILLAGNRVLTNRHVLDVFAEPLPGGAAFQLARRASIIFDPEALDEARRFEITGVVTAGRERIGRHVDLGKLDVAVVALEPGANAARLPAPAAPAAASTAEGGGIENVVVIGYPARPGYAQAPQDGETALKFWDRVGELYGDRFGVKYLSPGALMDRPGALAGDPQGWAFSHDATTFAGNSGSAVLALDGAFGLCGLHFGGSTLTMNLAHDLVTVRARGADFIDVTAL